MKKWNNPEIAELNINETTWNANDPKPCYYGSSTGNCGNNGNKYKCDNCQIYKNFVSSAENLS